MHTDIITHMHTYCYAYINTNIVTHTYKYIYIVTFPANGVRKALHTQINIAYFTTFSQQPVSFGKRSTHAHLPALSHNNSTQTNYKFYYYTFNTVQAYSCKCVHL